MQTLHPVSLAGQTLYEIKNTLCDNNNYYYYDFTTTIKQR